MGSVGKSATKIAGGIVDDVVSTASVGTVKTDFASGSTGGIKVNTDMDSATENFVGGTTGAGKGKAVTSALVGEMPKIPDPIDQSGVDKKANSEAAAKVESQKKNGINSTLLGGSADETDSNLRKKKLLGE